MRAKWSELPLDTQESIIDRIVNNTESVNLLAEEFNLKASSLGRTIRRIKERRGIRAVDVQKAVIGTSRPIAAKQPQIDPEYAHYNAIQEPEYFLPSWEKNTEKYRLQIVGDLEPGANPQYRAMYLTANQPITGIMYSDAHFPYEDKDATACALRVIESLPHDIIINGGDTFDCHGLSQYGNQSKDEFPKGMLSTDRREYLKFAEQLKDITDKDVLTIWGNHMNRYMLWMYKNPAIMYLEEMQIDNIMKLADFGWSPNVGEVLFNANINDPDFPNPELIVHHGDLARKNSGSSSMGESELRGYVSSISGHVHRLSAKYKKTMRGQVFMGEAGTLRSLKAAYLREADWQHGLIYLTFVPNVGVFGTPLLIKNGVTFYEGQEI